MRILVGKCFGLGNAVMSVPMVRALATLGTVDSLVGFSPDDVGACDVFLSLQKLGIIEQVNLVNAPIGRYDVAVMAIPFDGRWMNGVHFLADCVMDCRPRPDFSSILGFSSWLRHEVEYQMDNARELGFTGETPPMSFLPQPTEVDGDLVYLGLGFKRDRDSFWTRKHWGNDRYVEFVRHCRELRPSIRFRATGNAQDLVSTIIPIAREVGDFGSPTANITSAFDVVARCGSYFGNDTGMMHVAASLEKPTFGLMAYENVGTKNRPWCSRWMTHDFSSGKSDPQSVAEEFIRFVWGNA